MPKKKGVLTLFKDPRAYLAGLSTTAILGLGAVILLVTVTSLVAFSGWSPTGRPDDVGDLTLKAPPAPDREAQSGVRSVSAAAKAARGPVSAPGTARAVVAGDRASGGLASPSPPPAITPPLADAQPVPESSTVPLAGPAPANPAPPPGAEPSPPLPITGLKRVTGRVRQLSGDLTHGLGGSVLKGVTDQVGLTTDNLTGGLDGTFEQLDPNLNDTIGDPLNDVLQDPGGDILNGVLRAPPRFSLSIVATAPRPAEPALAR